jgi:signal transduction histidine kinase
MIGLLLMLGMWAFSTTVSWTGIGDAIGGLIVLMFPAALGDLVRNQHRSRVRAVNEARSREREQLARELHDTVAHHVSAIAVQAQAGRAVFAVDPDAAMQALATIEEEASRTLVEMRTMVSALRAGDDAELAPQAAFDDIERLARAATTLPVTVQRSGTVDVIEPSIDRALFRLAQESITNATRHARNATAVDVHLHGDDEEIRLTVTDDGDPRPFDSALHHGFGLVGMTERAHLLGGTLRAGPTPGRGWSVEAVLPRAARAKSGAGS